MNKLLKILADFDFNQINLTKIILEDDVSTIIITIFFNGVYYIQMNIGIDDLIDKSEEEVIEDFKEMFEEEFKALKVRTKNFKDTNI